MSFLSRKFGQTSFQCPVFGFGAASVSGEGAGYGFGDISEDESIELLQYAYSRGLRLFDTAPIYGFGTSETRMGKAFQKCRDEVFIVSKSGVDWHREGVQKGRVNRSNTREVTKRMLSESLERLQTDYLDLYMVHWPDELVDIREPMEFLAEAKAQGLIRNIGLCNTTLADLQKAQEIERIEALQSSFNFFDRGAAELFPYIREHKMAFMSYGTFDKGILTGRVSKDRVFDKSDARSSAPWWKKSDWKTRVDHFEKIRDNYLEAKSMSGVEFALSFNLSFEEVSVCLCGARNKGQVDSIVESLDNLDLEFARKIDGEWNQRK